MRASHEADHRGQVAFCPQESAAYITVQYGTVRAISGELLRDVSYLIANAAQLRHYAHMHPTPNAVEVSTEKILEAFEKAAVPDFTGQVKVHVRVLPTAAQEVEFIVERQRTEQVDQAGTIRDKETPHVTNDRVNTVRMKLRDLRLVLSTPVVCVSGNFFKGMLRSYAVQEVQ